MKENIMIKRCAAALGPLVLAVSLLFGAPAQAAPPDNPTGVKLADKPLTGAAHPGGVKGNPATIGRQAKTQTQAQALTTTSCSPGPCFKYATEIDNSVTATGAQVTMTVHKPKLLGWDWHSLAEQSIADSANANIVEVGWTVDPITNGDSNPHLFVFYWVNGVADQYNHNFTPQVGATLLPGTTLTVGTNITVSFEHYDITNGCDPVNCTNGWWMKAALGAATPTFQGVYPDTNWTSHGVTTFKGVTGGQVQEFGELAAGITPTQSHMGSGVLAGATQGASMTGYTTLGGGATAPAFNTSHTDEPDRWKLANATSTSFNYGGPGGTETIPGSVAADNCEGVGTGTNPSGLGSLCTYQTNPGSVPTGKVTQIDGSASTACRGDVGTAMGFAPIRNVAMSMFKKATFWANGTCTGTGTQLNHGRATLPAGLQAQAHFSYRVDSVYATCATGYPTTQPTC
jgi:hypothetical protein